MSKIVLYKLSSGEEIIGKLVELSIGSNSFGSNDTTVVLEDVRALVLQPTGQGQVGIAMVPWMAGIPEGEVEIEKSAILGQPKGAVPKQLEDVYLQQTSKLDLSSGAAGLDLSKR